MRHRRTIIVVATLLLLGTVLVSLAGYFSLFRTPYSRLALDASYPEMSADSKHRYLVLPIDHKDISKGFFKGFYILNPGFKRGGPIVFLLTDGQMELVDTRPQFSFFDEILPGASYVLIGVRGQSPTLFPEVFRPDGSLDLKLATHLYDSDQQIEDIEAVRLDMERRGDLPKGGNVSIYGASGAGVLAQQYLSRHGDHVDRTILEVTGAPDLSRNLRQSYARPFANYSPEGAALFRQVLQKRKLVSADSLSYVLYQEARNNVYGKSTQLEILNGLKDSVGTRYVSSQLHPGMNFFLARHMLSLPAAAMVKVRWYELAGYDLKTYRNRQNGEINLLYEFSKPVLKEFLDAEEHGEIAIKEFAIDRSGYKGEVLVISGQDDIVFSPQMGHTLAGAYNKSTWILLPGGHHLLEDRRLLQQVRTSFLAEGLQSQRLLQLRKLPRILQQQDSSHPLRTCPSDRSQ